MSGDEEFYEQLRLQQIYGENRDEGPDPYTFVDPSDGTVYEWDLDKKAWFPKVSDDFLAMYHANYGVPADEVNSSSAPAAQAASEVAVAFKVPGEEKKTADNSALPVHQVEQKSKAEKRKLEPGLPPDITEDEFVQVMSKCGIIMRDLQTEEYKIKLYKDKQGNLKGDGLCCYLKKESVGLALKLLDEDEIRGHKLHVEVAKFQLKGEYDASKKKKKCKDYKKKLSLQQKQLDWRPEKKPGTSRMRHERVVVIRNMFHPKDFEEDPLVLNEIREDLRTECEKFGQVKKVLIFDRHPDGVASVSFKEPEEGDQCIQALHGRWFGGRQLHAEAWDGVTDYQIEETSREREERLKGWETFISSSGNEKQATAAVPASAALGKGLAAGEQHSQGLSAEIDVNNKNHKHEDNGKDSNEDNTQSTDSSLTGSEDEADTGQP
ncbi:HIV Tat-specific factor 1 isoform X2 [Rhinatrema bivittatum]|uniref:HIV Tat-specific factor 1 isoform X2 n=1 Tax=Rhinatrema bivittatum TaxID=194408 RepID=UPI00112A34E5|nr:HIV Tat-specific factor 1 isoform X2 [Rhinatrema bivittatum]